MIGEGIHADALRYLVQQRAVHEVVVGSINGCRTGGLSIRPGGPYASQVPVRALGQPRHCTSASSEVFAPP